LCGWLVSWAVLTTQAWLLDFTVCMMKIYVYTVLRIIITATITTTITITFTVITVMYLCYSQNIV